MERWLEITFRTTAAEAELLAEMLPAFGALSATFFAGDGEEIFDTAGDGGGELWEETELTALFQGDLGALEILERVAMALDPAPVPPHTLREFTDQPWERSWMEGFVPLQATADLWIVPSWHTPPDPTAINLLIDPGMAFGTGHHQTTMLCLRFLREEAPGASDMVDYGCGSGILAIAAAKLGVPAAWGYDLDADAIKATLANARRNDVEDIVRIGVPAEMETRGTGLLVANLLLKPLLELAPYFTRLVRPGGRIAMSGILTHQMDPCRAAYEGHFLFDPPRCEDEWALLVATRRGK
jgi:ribosomal protein L11 methyltransferase